MHNKDNQQQSTEVNAMLTDADLDIINGGNWLGDAFRAIGGFISGALHGPGDLRRPLNRP